MMASDRRYPDLLLFPQHEALLTASDIAPTVAAARGYRSADTKAALKRLGFSDAQRNVPALVIPICSVATGKVVTYQARPDTPRVKDGKAIKYETPHGARMVLDCNPIARAWLGDPSRPLFVTEGVRKADAAVSHGLCCVGLLGVWNWRGRNDHGGLTALADWESVALNGRQIYLCFDSDVMTKPEVHAALVRLKAFLELRDANVALIYLLPGEGGAKVGLDDYFAAEHTVEELLALATSEVRVAPQDGDQGGPYLATSAGLVWGKPTTNGDVVVPLTNFTARIVADIMEDDGAEQHRAFEIEARLNGRFARFTIPAERFASMTWPVEFLGAQAIVYPGLGTKDHARAAIQFLSRQIVERQVFTHTGWRRIGDRWAYLHAGGAIGAAGSVLGIDIRLPETLQRFILPDPPQGDTLRHAVRENLRVLDVAPNTVTVPALAAAYRAPLGSADFSGGIAGPTGAGKTALAALMQQHSGAGMDAEHLPAHWSSTGNALEAVAFAAKDALLVVDDFSPSGSRQDVLRSHRDADRLLRAQGNRAGRQRMRADTSLRPPKPPRGLVLWTGEDVPYGQSLRARNLIIELTHGSIKWDVLTECQRAAAAGLYAQSMAAYVQWLAARYEAIQAGLRAEREELRQRAVAAHRRTPGIVADLALGVRYFLLFAVDAGAITRDEAEALWKRGWDALVEVGAAQDEHQVAADPAHRFVSLLAAAIASGRAHVAHGTGSEPADPGAWGWRKEGDAWRAQGNCIGWIDDDENIYLEPDAAYAAAQRLAADGGDSLGVGLHTLKGRLHERGVLASTETRGGKVYREVRRTLAGKRRAVLHLTPAALGSLSSDDGSPSSPTEDAPTDSAEMTRPAAAPLLGYSVGDSANRGVTQRVAHGSASGDTGVSGIGLPGLPVPVRDRDEAGAHAPAGVVLSHAAVDDTEGQRTWLRALYPERTAWVAQASRAEIAAAVRAALAGEGASA